MQEVQTKQFRNAHVHSPPTEDLLDTVSLGDTESPRTIAMMSRTIPRKLK
jgi:hypothetical protein